MTLEDNQRTEIKYPYRYVLKYFFISLFSCDNNINFTNIFKNYIFLTLFSDLIFYIKLFLKYICCLFICFKDCLEKENEYHNLNDSLENFIAEENFDEENFLYSI